MCLGRILPRGEQRSLALLWQAMSMEARPQAPGMAYSLGAIKPVKTAEMDEKAGTS
jgi:hypothetical protein